MNAAVVVEPSRKPFLDLSCADWRQRVRRGESLMPDGLVLDEERADRAAKIFGYLRIPDIEGTPSFEEVAGEWAFELVRAVFGTWDGVERSVKEFFELMAKKNAKTTVGAGVMLTALIVNKRPKAQFLLIAPTMDVADLAFSQAVGMIQLDDDLSKLFHVKEYKKRIVHRTTGATLSIKSFDPSIVTGAKPAGVLLDELHVIAEHSNADRVIGQLRGGMMSQPESFMIIITTQSERVPSGIFRAELNKARKVRDGLLKLKLLPILYEFPEDMVEDGSWQEPQNWWMVTPNLGKSVTIARLEEDYATAVATSDEELRRWASQHLNIQIGMALRNDHWNGAAYWLKASQSLSLERILEESDCITLGIDGGGLDDMLALSVCGRHKDSRVWRLWSHAWLHDVALERRKSDVQHYRDFEAEGSLTVVKDLGDDLDELGDYVGQVIASGRLAGEQSIGVDQAGLGLIIDELVYRGVDQEKQIVGIPQGWRLTSAIKTMERGLAQGTIVHADQALTRWCAENARVEPRGNAIMITKQISGSAKIDPLMSAFNAVELMSRNPAAARKYQMMIIGG
jgi:phage terminase large subunit-like protein